MEYNVLNISGGKDSTAMLLLALKEMRPENIICVFADTGNEAQPTYQYIDYLQDILCVEIRRVKADFTEALRRKRELTVPVKWAKSGVSEEKQQRVIEACQPSGNPFLDLCMYYGMFPSAKARFCTKDLKIFPIQNQIYLPLIERGHTIVSWQGVRKEESKSRAKLKEREAISEKVSIYRPLLEWTHEEVFGIHRKYGVEPNPLYKMGFARVGCFPCHFSRKDDLYHIQARFPGEVDRLTEWEILVQRTSRRDDNSNRFFCRKNKRGGFLTAREVFTWSKTTRGGKNFDLFKTAEYQDTDTCESIYGLCE